MLRFPRCLALIAMLPLSAQDWDVRVEWPFPQGQNLLQTTIMGTGQLVSGELDTGKGALITLNRELIRFGPVLKLEAGLEYAWCKADGTIQQGSGATSSSLDQKGLGLGLNAQFWIPFTGVCGEMGLIQRFQSYRFESTGTGTDKNLSRTWLRVGTRYRFPSFGLKFYLCASYQQPMSKDKPVRVNNVQDLATYLYAQGSGQEFERMWTFGAGLIF
jgi:hypothetical protein